MRPPIFLTVLVLGGCGNERDDGAASSVDIDALILSAGNAERESDRWQFLLELDAAIEDGHPLRGDLDTLLPVVDQWANARDFWEPGDQAMAGESGYLAGWFGLRVWPDGVGELFPPAVADARLDPLWCLYRGRMLVWVTLQNGLLEEQALADARTCLEASHAAFPNNRIIGMYLDEPIPWEPLPVDGDVPDWARDQREALEKMDQILDYWIVERQAADGQFGGGWGDDVEIWRRFTPVIVGFDQPERTASFAALAEGVWDLPRMEGGYTSVTTDVEHSAEDSGDTLTSMLLLSDDPAWPSRTEELVALADTHWFGINDSGGSQFRSTQIDSSGASDDPSMACDTAYHTRVLQPALLRWQRTGDSTIGAPLVAWLRNWADAAAREEAGKPAGVLPNALHWPTGSAGGTSGNWLDPGCHLNADAYAYPRAMSSLMRALVVGAHVAGDPTLLEPIRTMADHRRNALTDGVGPTGSATWAATEAQGALRDAMAKHRVLTGDTQFDDLLVAEGEAVLRARLTGDWTLVDELVAGSARALSIDREAFTSEVRYTDRIVKFHSGYASLTADVDKLDIDTLYGMVTGDVVDPSYAAAPAVRWGTSPRELAIRVTTAQPTVLDAEIFEFGGGRPLSAEVLGVSGNWSWSLTRQGQAVASGLGSDRQTVMMDLPSSGLYRFVVTGQP